MYCNTVQHMSSHTHASRPQAKVSVDPILHFYWTKGARRPASSSSERCNSTSLAGGRHAAIDDAATRPTTSSDACSSAPSPATLVLTLRALSGGLETAPASDVERLVSGAATVARGCSERSARLESCLARWARPCLSPLSICESSRARARWLICALSSSIRSPAFSLTAICARSSAADSCSRAVRALAA